MKISFKKKLLSLMLSVILIIAVIPFGAFTVSAATSGKCGDNLTWKYNLSTYALTISGAGPMDNYFSSAPWNSYRSSIKTVIINDGVTSIGDCSFTHFTELTSITLPDKIESIGNSSFSYCSKLTNIAIGNEVKIIGQHAFYCCNKLKSITIPNSVNSIGDLAFFNCSELENIVVENNNTEYFSEGNCLIKIATKKLVLGCKNSIIPNKETVTSIGNSAFYNCSELSNIIIPDNITSIGDSAFSYCYHLTTVSFGKGISSISNSAFESCNNLAKVNISNLSQWFHIRFYNQYSNPLYYAQHLFVDDKEVTNLVTPEGVTSINFYVFYNCTGLTSITIPNSVTSIGDGAFYNCTGLTNVIYCGTKEQKNKISINSYNDALINATWKYHIYDNDCDTTCNVCGCVRTITHAYSNDCDTTCNICGYARTITHTYSNSCDATCNVCGYVRTVEPHSYKSAWSNNSTNHWHECSVCGDKKDTANHTYDNSCDTTCNTCGYVRTITHNYSSTWSNNSTNHWHECSVCGVTKDNGNHIYDNACDTTCNACGYERSITHTYTNSCDTTCNVCGYVRTITHSYSLTWSNNSTNHWHECSVCGDKKDNAIHDYDNACDTTCNTCGYIRTVPHDYVNGKCTICSFYDSNVVINSGEFTGGAKWYVNSSTNALYIYGNGETDKYKTSASAPWYANRSAITKVYVEPTVTKLGNLSFDCLYNLQNVYFDTKDITFGYYIFPEKSNLTIYGVSGGTIESYANNNGITFSKYTNTNTPISPIVLSAENSNITVQAVSGYEYSIDGINFQDSNIFTNVDGDKILTVCQRIKETDKYKCSATSTKTKVIFITAPKIKLKGATKIEVDTISGYEYSLDEIEWQSTALFNKLIPEEEYTLYVRLKNSSGVTVVNLAQDGVDFTTGEFDSISDIPLTAQRMTFLINSLLSSTNEMASDVNGDKKIDILDLVALKKQIANI